MNNPEILKLFLQSLFLVLCLPSQGFSAETDTITSSLPIKDPDFIVSRGQVFKLGFFTPEDTRHRYLGVFYSVSEKSVIWVANRDRPLTDSSGTVTISRDGNLVLMNGKNETVWSTNATTSSPLNAAAAQIQDNGNLVLRDVSTGNLIWDCFSHPSNVFLPTLRLIDDTNTGNKVIVSAWKNESDPEVGNFTVGLQALNIPQIFNWHNGRPYWRSGPWNGQILIGVQDMYLPYLDPFSLVNQSGIFYFTAPPGKVLMNIVLNSSGSLQQRLWDNQKKSWDIIWVAPQNECDVYGKCGPFGSCNQQDSPICSCLTGFEPVNKDEWSRGNWTSGCFRRTLTQCDRSDGSGSDRRDGDGFLRLQFMKVPDFPEKFPSSLEDECRSRCLSNCSCIAYAYEPNIGCMFWSERLIDVQKFPGVGVDLHIRLAASELGDRIKDQKTSEQKQTFSSDSTAIVLKDESEKVNLEELPLFTFETLSNATNQFDEENMLGKGGFGPVYKGKLTNGKEIAVKRLSAASGQGMEEFMNEDSRLRIIHRDLKPSNVLLDGDWNPKISDFGMARIFGGNQDQGNTARVVGTYGYMAPEYAMEGRFSEKSDVYSFGVLMLEIISGKKNTHYYNQEWSLSLLGCAWKLWNEDNGMSFVDQMIASSNFQGEIVRCIHIALLCVQEFPENRPAIQTVLSMLSREIMDLPLPEQPVFAEKWNRFHVGSNQPTSQIRYSINELTVTVLDGR
ncbi:UNVERIFIED_CONTAM: G-type lectin S-receptor-like serine/threonine-protein kinase [Sesamum radiatum]|uniref:Receptor-like serine/threonine-protein kinase n=1 Tax=Sesamum radiatum TaxID=300843 RepID=A0AAW2K2I0_SESRA